MSTQPAVVSLLSGAPSVSLVAVFPAAELQQRWLKEGRIDVSAELRGLSEVRLYRCEQTGLQFFWPVTLAGGAAFYEQLQETCRGYYLEEKWEFGRAVEDLADAKSVLEVGCGAGAFLDRLKKRGIAAEGIELNVAAAEAARRRGLSVRTIDLSQLAASNPGSYDAVCAFQVLEHVDAPAEFLRHLLALVRPGGRILLGVPNADGCLRHEPDHLLDMPPHHITRWTADVFRASQSLLPWRLRRVCAEPLARYHVPWYLTLLKKRLPGWAGRIAYVGSLVTVLPALVCFGALRRRIPGHSLYVCAERTE